MKETVEEQQDFVKDITKMSDDFDRWYTDVVRKAELADWSGVRGMMVVRPYGWAMWEAITRAFDDMIKESGHENWAFPLLIPQSLLVKEAEHIEGFGPEVAWVTKAGASMEELEEPLAVRPTSETIIGHTILGYYRSIAEDWLAVPVLVGRKSPAETFPGAVHTLTLEGLMRDAMALQMGTSHYFGQNFARAYDISFSNKENVRELCYSTSWGITTRMVGAIVMAHGDDSGLIVPPKVAPVQVVVVPIFRDAEGRAKVEKFINSWTPELKAAGIRFRVDWRDERPGDKYAHWELKGVPLRLNVGGRDADAGQVEMVDRLSREKRSLPAAGLAETLRGELEKFQASLLERAQAFQRANTFELGTLDEVIAHFRDRGGFVWVQWCGDDAEEARVKTDAGGVTIRTIDEDAKPTGKCFVCGKLATLRVALAKAY